MAKMNIIQAVNSALMGAMAEDNSIIVMGEDVGKFGGVFRATLGLQEKFGEDRVIDTPLSEGGIIGTAIGMALNGIKPVAEIQFSDFIFPAFDQIVNEAAKMRYRSGGEWTCPMVIRTPFGGGIKGGHYHSQSPESLFIHTPGLKVIAPSNPYDAKGLLLASIADPDPVIFFEPKRVYRASVNDVPEEQYTLPLGKANIVRPGKDLTVVAWGAMVHEAQKAVDEAAEEGVDCELIDLRSLLPWDAETVIESVKKTGRCVVVYEAPRTLGFGTEIISQIMEDAFDYLEAPVSRVTGYDTPFPYTLEHDYLPLAHRIVPAIKQTAQYS